MCLTKNPFLYLRLVLFALLIPGIASAVIEPRIIGGFVEEDPEIRGFMAYLKIERPTKPNAKTDIVTLILNGSEYSGKLVSGAQSGTFSGQLVDCGMAETPCEGVAGNVCLIQQGSNTIEGKIENCQTSGGSAAVLISDQPNDLQGLYGSSRFRIPAVSVSAREGLEFFNALGGKIKGNVIEGRGVFACGGTLIEKDWVLTAAHCVQDADSVEVLLGGQDVSGQEKEYIPAKRIVVHQGFDKTILQNDIALLQLESPAKTDTLARIDSASLNSAISSGATAYAFGRGVQDQLGPGEEPSSHGTDKLFVVGLPLVANDDCKDRLNAVHFDFTGKNSPAAEAFNSGILCAGGVSDGGKGACFGDSGGPLAVAKNNGSIYLAGITSGGIGCAHPDTPDVYTRVSAYARAIDDVISGKSIELKGKPVDEETAVLGESGEQGGGGGGAFNSGWWVLFIMLYRRRLKVSQC